MSTDESAPTPRSKGSTAERLMAAALQQIGSEGFHGATTRTIAAEAGVSEVTLFRRFGNKRDLVAAALGNMTEPFRSVGSERTDDVFADLVRLGVAYQRFVERRPQLVVRLMAEVVAGSEIGVIASELIAGNAESAAALVGHHQRAGRLVTAPVSELLAAYLGPILLSVAIGHILAAGGPAPALDIEDHTHRFLGGHSGHLVTTRSRT